MGPATGFWMTEVAGNLKKDIAAVCGANYPPDRGSKAGPDCPIRHNMITFVAGSGRLLLLAAFAGILSCTQLRGEGEVPGGTVTSSGGAPSDAGGGVSSSNGSPASGGDFGSTPALGLGIFSRFPVNVSLSVQGGYDDNVDTLSENQAGSWFTTAGLVLAYKLNTPRTQATLSSNLGFTYYSNIDVSPFEPNLNLTLDVTHKVSPRLQIGFQSNTVYQAEPDFQYGLGTNRRAGNYFYTTDSLSGTYTWLPRFSTATSYGFSGVHYDDIASGLLEDRIENTIGNEFRFLMWPTTSLVVAYRFEAVNYQHEGEVISAARFDPVTGMLISPAVTLQRDSTTHFVLGGFDHAFSPRLSASVRGGAEFRDYETVGERSSPYFESTVNYSLGKDTSLSWNMHYGIEEGDIVFNPTRKSFRTGVQGKHNLTARMSATVAFYFDHDDYSETETVIPGLPTRINPAFTEDTIYFDLSFRYAMTRYMGIQAGYEFSQVSSGLLGRDYSRNHVWAGINVAF
jgi:hypothetical protein